MIPWCFRYRGVLCYVEERFETGYESASCYSLLSTTFSVHCLVLCQYITKFANVLHVLFCPVCLHSRHWCVLLPVMVWLRNTIQLLDVTHSTHYCHVNRLTGHFLTSLAVNCHYAIVRVRWFPCGTYVNFYGLARVAIQGLTWVNF